MDLGVGEWVGELGAAEAPGASHGQGLALRIPGGDGPGGLAGLSQGPKTSCPMANIASPQVLYLQTSARAPLVAFFCLALRFLAKVAATWARPLK